MVTTNNLLDSGNLSTRSLASIVNPSQLIRDSEYLETHLVAVPNAMAKDFHRSYETLAPMVVPRSASQVAADDEFILFAVVTFKKHSAEFIHKCREKRWTPRDYKYKAGGKEEEVREVDKLSQDERKLWGEALRLGRTGYSESAMIWIHVLALRVFVETVLRYGLPLNFVCGLVQVRNILEVRFMSLGVADRQLQTNSKLAKKAKASLDVKYSYLGGNAFGRDSKGRVKKDDQAISTEMQAAGHIGDSAAEYSAYVYYEFEIA